MEVYLCPATREKNNPCLNELPCAEHDVRDKDDSIYRFGRVLSRTRQVDVEPGAHHGFDITVVHQPREDGQPHHRCNLPYINAGYGSTGFDDGAIVRCNGCGTYWFSAPYFGSLGPVSVWRRVRPWHWLKRRQIGVQGRKRAMSWGTSDSDSPEPGTVRNERRW